MQPQALETCAACVGLDWADAKHNIGIQAAGTERRELLVLAHRPEAMDAWGQTLRTRCNGQPVAVCLELKKGPIVSALRAYDCLVLFPVNPFTLAKYREALTPSHAKEDPTDAELQVELLLKHRAKLLPLSPQSPPLRTFAQLVEHRQRLVGDKVRLTHRLTSALKNSLPHVLRWFQDKATAAEGVITPNPFLVQARVAQLRVTLQAVADVDNAIAPCAQAHPDFPWFDALPGVGAVLAPRLLVAFGAPRER